MPAATKKKDAPKPKEKDEKPIEGQFKEEGAPLDLRGSDRALAVRKGDDLAIVRDPDVVLGEAKKAAEALAKVISSKAKKVVLNGEQYLEVEDWTMLGQFYGVSAKTEWTREIVLDGARGWEARVVIVDMRTGIEVGGAEAMCLDSEENWGVRTKFEWMDLPAAIEKYSEAAIVERQKSKWPNKPMRAKVKVGEEPVSDASRRSMAQTRATSRALAMRLRWIPVLAGFSGTPAEDMPRFKGGGGSDYEEAPPPKDAAPKADVAPKAEAELPDPPGWEHVMLFHRWTVENGADPKTKTFRKFLNDHGFTKWSLLKAAWGKKCEYAADKEYGMTVKDEVLAIIGQKAEAEKFDPDDVI